MTLDPLDLPLELDLSSFFLYLVPKFVVVARGAAAVALAGGHHPWVVVRFPRRCVELGTVARCRPVS